MRRVCSEGSGDAVVLLQHRCVCVHRRSEMVLLQGGFSPGSLPFAPQALANVQRGVTAGDLN